MKQMIYIFSLHRLQLDLRHYKLLEKCIISNIQKKSSRNWLKDDLKVETLSSKYCGEL